MKIAIAGKGGSGKTTLAATLARLFARRGRQVLAVDADSNPNLAASLGLAREDVPAPVPRDLLQDRTTDDGRKITVLSISAAEVAARFGAQAPDGVRLLIMGRVAHAGAG
jgi:CO dehydrogenase maturation factor